MGLEEDDGILGSLRTRSTPSSASRASWTRCEAGAAHTLLAELELRMGGAVLKLRDGDAVLELEGSVGVL